MKTLFFIAFFSFASLLQSQSLRLVVPVGHSGELTAAAISPDEKYVLTGSSDQTAILWSIKGKEIFTFKGHTAGIRGVAFLYTANEKFALTADGNGTIKLWTLDGVEKQSLGKSPNFRHEADWVRQLRFSPDGKTVCVEAHNFDYCMDILSGEEVPAFAPAAEQKPPTGLSSTGSLVFSTNFILSLEQKTAILWDRTGKKIQSFEGHSIAVSAVDFAPTEGGDKVLTCNANGRAYLWDIANNTVVPNFAAKAGDVWSLKFSPDGQAVLTGSGKMLDLQGNLIRSFDANGPTAFSADGKLVLTGTGKGVKIWDGNTGKLLKDLKTQGDDFFDNLAAAAFSPDGKQILTGGIGVQLWSWEKPQAPLHVLSEGRGGFGPRPITSLAFSPDGKSALAPGGEAIVTQWDISSGTEINTFEGHHEQVNVVTTAPAANGGMYVLTGSDDNTAKLWDPANNVVKSYAISQRQLGDPIGEELVGGEIQTYRGHSNDVVTLAFSPAGAAAEPKYVMTGSLDNTVKIWDRASGTEIATLITLGTSDWVVTTPSGLFDASPGAMNSMYYALGTELIELEQLKERYYEPGLLAKVMGFHKGAIRDVSAMGQLALYPEMEAAIKEMDQLRIQLTARSGGMGKLSFFINGKEVAEDLNPEQKTKLTVDLNIYEKYYLPGANTLALRAYNSAGWLKSAAYELSYNPPVTARGTGTGSVQSLGNAKPHLYAIVVGTSDYSGTQLDLRFPDLDAASMAQALSGAGKALFEDRVHLRLLTTDGKTPAAISSKKNIAAAFSEYAAQAKPTDILVAYFSGHGLSYGSAEKSQFYYMTKDIASPDLKDPEVRNNYTVSSDDLTRWLTAIAAKKQVMILDACNSGKVVESLAAIGARELNSTQIRALDRMKDRTGMFILTGAAGDKVSYEASQYGQGLLTYSLLQGMSGLALTSDKRVDVMTLFQYARDEVPALAKSIRQVQTPVLAFPAGGGSFDIGIVDATVKIPLAQVKPVFIRNNFQDEEAFDDGLGLTKALADYFQLITARGAQAELIYVDVNEYENAYSIKGRYSISGDAVTVRGRIFQGKTVKGEFSVTGKKTALPALVEAIVDKVSGML